MNVINQQNERKAVDAIYCASINSFDVCMMHFMYCGNFGQFNGVCVCAVARQFFLINISFRYCKVRSTFFVPIFSVLHNHGQFFVVVFVVVAVVTECDTIYE